ncbi:unnamed protein product [Allacma fusca]|uniref:Uncharacterized protein n=1 Tax=Allacma fusca TaxID=39272 RepID=A0A8J2KY05_9HEXA|nr:unnamed protein product [Allacma fusca]
MTDAPHEKRHSLIDWAAIGENNVFFFGEKLSIRNPIECFFERGQGDIWTHLLDPEIIIYYFSWANWLSQGKKKERQNIGKANSFDKN